MQMTFFFPTIVILPLISLIQSDIISIASWISAHYLTINTSKTKYMFISFKSPAFFSTFPSLYLNGSLLDRVSSFKYLGILISSNLSWTPHLLSISRKSRQLIGILYRLFYRHSNPSLFKLYSTLIRPHLEYCTSVWDPSSSATISQLENIQFFALKLCSKNWSSGYSSLLHLFNSLSLSLHVAKNPNLPVFPFSKFLMVLCSSHLILFTLYFPHPCLLVFFTLETYSSLVVTLPPPFLLCSQLLLPLELSTSSPQRL